jgi:PKD repeat protein
MRANRRTMGLRLGAGLVVCSVLGAMVGQGDASPPTELDLRGGGAVGTGGPPPGGGGPGTGEIPAEIEIRGQVAGEIDEDVTLTAAPKDRDETLSNVSWEFGDGARAMGNPARHAYDRAGEFTITARGTLGTGAARRDVSAFARFEVLSPTEPLEARFEGPATAETDERVSFVNRSTGATRYEWAFEGADRDTWAGSTPPPLVWTDAGEYRVTLVAHRGAERDDFSLVITVSEPRPGAPVVGNIAVPAGPYDTATPYTFSADLTAENPMSGCEWSLDGIPADCDPSSLPGGGTRLSVTHRFASPGPKTIGLTVTGPGGVTTPPAVSITVEQLSPPTAAITVSGADPEGSGWVVNDTTPVTFDGRGSLPDYDRYEWHDLDTGARATGPQWVTTLSALADPHRIQLTVVSDRQGGISDTATVNVRVVSTPVQVLPEAHVFAGPTLEDPLRATARDPFGSIEWLNMYGRVVGTCVDGDGAETPLDLDYTSTPLAMGAPQNFVIDPDGTIHYQTDFDWCPNGGVGGTISEFELWVEVMNDVGEVIVSEHLFSL